MSDRPSRAPWRAAARSLLIRRAPILARWLWDIRETARTRWTPLERTRFEFLLAKHGQVSSADFEINELRVVCDLLPDSDLFVDVGANVGLYTCVAKSRGKRVIAVEPHPTNLRLLRRALHANGWEDVEVVAAGLAQRPGTAELHGFGTGASLLAGWAAETGLLRRTVKIETLDSLLQSRSSGGRLLIKVDVEGAEFDVLQGAAATLRRIPAPTWLVEICLSEHHPTGINPRFHRTFGLFFDAGYEAFAVADQLHPVKATDIAQWSETGTTPYETHNYLFRPA